VFEPGDHATTFGGQPLAAAAARATLAVMQREDACGRARRAGDRLVAGLLGLDGVQAVRGLGLLVAAELDDGIEAGKVAAAALDTGLVVNAVTPTSLRLAPSLLVSDTEIDEAVGILGAVLAGAGAVGAAGGDHR
jgi:acetylornithine/succinyldiaminopimelate/putrescine aminotransferase